jgi:uncharacterized protein (TIGR03118 family)
MIGSRALRRTSTLAVALLVALTALAGSAAAKGFTQTNLVSDLPDVALFEDPNVVNAWGTAFNAAGTILWVVDNGTGLSTTYAPDGTPLSLVVTIPPPLGAEGPAAPTGIVRNDTADFVISEDTTSDRARFLFATEDGTISGWSPNVDVANAILVVDRSEDEAVYKGIAIASTEDGNFLYATDFHNGVVDVFDGDFNFLGSFTDPDIPAGFAPFGIRLIDGVLFVTYAKQLPPENRDDQAGPGNGFVVTFSPDGGVLALFAAHGPLNSPWGLSVAPRGFAGFSRGALLVGNFGDGRINAYDLRTAKFLGQLIDRTGQPLVIDGLWGLTVRPVGPTGNTRGGPLLYFTAGPNDEADGLAGTLGTSVETRRSRR